MYENCLRFSLLSENLFFSLATIGSDALFLSYTTDITIHTFNTTTCSLIICLQESSMQHALTIEIALTMAKQRPDAPECQQTAASTAR